MIVLRQSQKDVIKFCALITLSIILSFLVAYVMQEYMRNWWITPVILWLVLGAWFSLFMAFIGLFGTVKEGKDA